MCSVSSQGSPVPSAIAAFLFWEVPMMYANPPLRRRLLWKGGDAGPPRLPLLCTPYGKCLAAGPAPSTHSASLVGLGLLLLLSFRAERVARCLPSSLRQSLPRVERPSPFSGALVPLFLLRGGRSAALVGHVPVLLCAVWRGGRGPLRCGEALRSPGGVGLPRSPIPLDL